MSPKCINEFKVESIVPVDERGQMVLPKSIRQQLGISPGDRLAVAVSRRNGKACCIYLFKVEELAESAQRVVGPLPEALDGGGGE